MADNMFIYVSGSLEGGVGRGSARPRAVSDLKKFSSLRVRKMKKEFFLRKYRQGYDKIDAKLQQRHFSVL